MSLNPSVFQILIELVVKPLSVPRLDWQVKDL